MIEVLFCLVLYMIGIATGLYAASQIETHIDNNINNKNNNKKN